MIINDYSVLFDAIAKRFADTTSMSFSFDQSANYTDFKQYSDIVEKHANSRCVYYDIAIPGNMVNRIYIIEDYQEGIDPIRAFYRADGKLSCLISICTRILYEDKTSRKDLSKFFNEYKEAISFLLSGEEYTNIMDKRLLSLFGTFDVIYRIFAIEKDLLIKMTNEDEVNSLVKSDNSVYENMRSLLTNRTKSLTEARVIRAIKDGVNNVQANSTIQARYVPTVQ